MRIVSLLPSATEIILALTGPDALNGRGPVQLVGRSHECDWPTGVGLERVPALTAARTTFTTSAAVDQAVRSALKSGESLYTLDTALLASLRPDVIVTQDLCEVCSIDLGTVRAAAATMSPSPQVVSLNPQTLDGVLDDLETVGQAIGLQNRAIQVIAQLRERVSRAQEYVNPYTEPVPVAFLEWTDPLFIGGHWTPQLIERAGGSQPLNPTRPIEGSGAAAGMIGQTMRRAGKSIRISPEALVESRPEWLIVCPCGLTLEQAWRETDLLSNTAWWSKLPAVQRARVAVVDGSQMFNRPGPRLVDALEFLTGLLGDRPNLIPAGFPWRAWPDRAR
jgi:ABC-type Fe3+-hydroxamate transport system substrate-binding protein